MARNTGKRPHELTLELFAKNATQTPTKIDAYVKNGPYSSKHIWFLRKLGHDITVNKDGRTVLSYTYNGPGTATQTVAKNTKPVKAKAAKVVKIKVTKPTKIAKTPEQIKAENLAKMKAVTTKRKMKKTVIVNDDTEVSDVTTSYSIDPAWDSTEGLDIKKLVA